MRPFSLNDMISQAVGNIIGQHIMSCIFIDTDTPSFIRKLKQGIVFYTKKRKEKILALKQNFYHRTIVSLRITDSRSVLS